MVYLSKCLVMIHFAFRPHAITFFFPSFGITQFYPFLTADHLVFLPSLSPLQLLKMSYFSLLILFPITLFYSALTTDHLAVLLFLLFNQSKRHSFSSLPSFRSHYSILPSQTIILHFFYFLSSTTHHSSFSDQTQNLPSFPKNAVLIFLPLLNHTSKLFLSYLHNDIFLLTLATYCDLFGVLIILMYFFLIMM